MPFELIMLLGFFGTVLASLLPATPEQENDAGFHGTRRVQRRTGKQHGMARSRRVTARDEAATRCRSAGCTAA